jgi:hypothetical protein
VRRANDRSVLSRAKPRDLYRLAKWAGSNIDRECYCRECITNLIEHLARKLE